MPSTGNTKTQAPNPKQIPNYRCQMTNECQCYSVTLRLFDFWTRSSCYVYDVRYTSTNRTFNLDTGWFRRIISPCGSSSVVERHLAKVRVASSNLVSRFVPPRGGTAYSLWLIAYGCHWLLAIGRDFVLQNRTAA